MIRRHRVCAAAVAAALMSLLGAWIGAPPALAAPALSLSAALEQALKTNPSTLLRRQLVEAAEGQALQARGAFDTVVGASVGRSLSSRPLRADETSALQASGIDLGSAQAQQSTSYRLGADKTLLNGLSVGAGFSVTSNADNVTAASGVPQQLSGALSFTLRVPMGRNSGRETVGAEYDAAQTEVEAFRAELHHGNAQIVLDTTLAYWDWVARSRRLEIAFAAERRIDDLIGEMNRLIAAGEMPRADIELALASRAERAAQRVLAEQAVQEARRVLARLLGVPPERAQNLGVPVEDFPAYRTIDTADRDADLARSALAARADVEATRYREQAARYRLVASRNNLKPQIDLSLSLGYVGLSEGTASWRMDRSMERSAGPAVGAAVTMQWPWENSLAIGLQRSSAAQYDAASIRLRDLQNAIGTNVPVALAALARAVVQGADGAEAVRRYEATVRNERSRRRLGNATVIDVINVEDRLTNALLTDVALRQNYANAIAQLLFELGSLVRRDGEEYRVDLDTLRGARGLAE